MAGWVGGVERDGATREGFQEGGAGERVCEEAELGYATGVGCVAGGEDGALGEISFQEGGEAAVYVWEVIECVLGEEGGGQRRQAGR